MSFLLDALGKADDDRRRAIVPELRASRYQRRSPWRRVLRIALMLIAILLAFILGYIARPYIDRGSNAVLSAVETDGSLSKRATTSASLLVPPDDAGIVARPEVTSEPAIASQSPQSLASGPIELSVISYSNQPAARFVMLDGVVMYEGDMLNEELRLVLIKPNGVVLERNGAQFSIGLGGAR